MALILAIEPDRRQAGQLTALVKGRLHAEVVLGDSAETALAALGSRVPDLVLTTALLSPKDESVLAERLRALDGAAAHVQTLTIPVLATISRRRSGKGSGVLSSLLGDKLNDDSMAAEGCDPAMFAEQCKEYLERAAVERASTIEQLNDRIEKTLEPLPAPVVQAAAQQVAALEPAPHFEAEAQHQAETAYESAPSSDANAGYEAVTAYETAPAYVVAQASGRAPIYQPPSPTGSATHEHDARAESSDADDFAQPAAAIEPQTAAPPAKPEASANRKFRPRVNDDEPPAALLAAVAAFAEIDEPPADAAVQAAENLGEATAEFTDAITTEPQRPQSRDSEVLEDSAVHERPSATDEVIDVDLSSLFDDTPRAATPDDEEPVIPVYDIDTSIFDGASGNETLLAEAADQDDSVHTLDESADTPAVKPEVRTWPILEGIATGDMNATDGSPVSSAPAATISMRTAADELREWSDIIEALRRDAHPAITPAQPSIERAPDTGFAAPVADPEPVDPVNVEAPANEPPVAAQAEAVVAEPALEQATTAPEAVVPDAGVSDPAPAEPTPPRRKGRRKASVEDEWGFFDPDRAGFAALLAKLEEITEDDSAKPQRT